MIALLASTGLVAMMRPNESNAMRVAPLGVDGEDDLGRAFLAGCLLQHCAVGKAPHFPFAGRHQQLDVGVLLDRLRTRMREAGRIRFGGRAYLRAGDEARHDRHDQREQQREDRHDDHQLDEREAARPLRQHVSPLRKIQQLPEPQGPAVVRRLAWLIR